MALVPADDEVAGAEGEVESPLSLHGLAEEWEADAFIRHRARQQGSLLVWGGASQVGIASMMLILHQNTEAWNIFIKSLMLEYHGSHCG